LFPTIESTILITFSSAWLKVLMTENVCPHSLFFSHNPLRHIYCSCSLCWQRTEQRCLINGLICRLFCSLLFSFNKVLLCYCYRRRENMKKHPKLLRHSMPLTNHTSYCCVRAIIARRVYACKCVFVCEVCAFVLLRVLWQAGRCKRWGASKQLA